MLGHEYISAKFHLVDLAGSGNNTIFVENPFYSVKFVFSVNFSERAKRTGAVGVRFKESVTINRGLLGIVEGFYSSDAQILRKCNY